MQEDTCSEALLSPTQTNMMIGAMKKASDLRNTLYKKMREFLKDYELKDCCTGARINFEDKSEENRLVIQRYVKSSWFYRVFTRDSQGRMIVINILVNSINFN